jgi:hypothetical protein
MAKLSVKITKFAGTKEYLRDLFGVDSGLDSFISKTNHAEAPESVG